ncbi:hypothetical protein AB0M47_11840 [Hamadaea sp. NPDC051192]|uniref:hypothetical protein n=1 Tax=Hamadaea sp. NPDC051192 TaxID=3154940 RepID=UPI003434389B
MLPPRRFRLLSSGLLALFAAVPVVLPGSAAAASCAPMAYAAESSADLVRLTALDLRPLGVPVGPVAELALASSRSTMDARKPVAARAAARYVEVGVVGLKLSPLFLGSAVSQQAPPTHAGPAGYNALSQDAGVAKVGTGDLSAHATWADRMACGRQTGPAGVSSAAVADLSVLPSSSSALVRVPRNLSSQAVTGLRTAGGRTASVAAAEVELTDLRLLNGAVAVKVLKPPTLTATATGSARTSSVEYSNPLLEISGSGVPTQRLSTPAKHVDVVLPATGGDPLGTLLRGLDVPLLNSLVGNVHVEGLTENLQVPGPETYALLRISLGALDKSITDAAVEAEAASLRIQLILCGPDQAQVTVLDLAVGLLRTSATAPNVPVVSSPTPSTSPSAATSVSPAPSTSPAGCGGPGCGGPGTLPQTGMGPVAYVVGAGVLLALLGRLMILLARRRSV